MTEPLFHIYAPGRFYMGRFVEASAKRMCEDQAVDQGFCRERLRWVSVVTGSGWVLMEQQDNMGNRGVGYVLRPDGERLP